MAGTWTKTYAGGMRIEIDRNGFGKVLIDAFGHVLDARARAVSTSAKTYVPNGKQFIGYKGVRNSPRELWTVGSARGTGSSLLRGMEIPVALVFNNSYYASPMEFGQRSRGRGVRSRKSAGASIFRVTQTRPVYRAARSVGGGYLVWKPRVTRRMV